MQPDFVSRKLLNAALELFDKHGFADVEPRQIAEAAGCSLDELYTRFPRKQAFIMGLFGRITGDLHAHAADTPPGTVASRFQFLMRQLLKSLEPYRSLLQQLMPAMLDPENRLGVLGPSTDHIRAEVQGQYTLLVLGADDCPSEEHADSLIQFLYFAHLGLIFLFLQDQGDGPEFMENNLNLTSDLITVGQKTLLPTRNSWLTNRLAGWLGFPRPDQLSTRVDRLVQDFIHPPHDSAHFSQAENILRELFRFRRLQPDAGSCQANPCSQCLALHLHKVQRALATGTPIPLVLPAFPAKSANLKKVTGPLPDLGEELALRFLQERCDAIAEAYEPGAELVICSDGRVFSDVVGVRDVDVTAYRHAVIEMIDRLGLKSLQVFDLDDVCADLEFDSMRDWLMDRYAEPLEDLRDRTRQHPHHQQLFNGIHRFMFEDLVERDTELSRTQAKKRSKDLAFEVIRRSNSWSRVVAEFFPDSLRLSIHPHAAHSDKIGILLGDADDLWLTPWHGVAILRSDRFLLTRRHLAEEQGAVLIERNDGFSHFEMLDHDGDGNQENTR